MTTLALILVALTLTHKSLNLMAQVVNVPVLYPETLSDSVGNTADRYSNISFVDVGDNHTYKSQGRTSSDVGPISPLYDLANSIVHSSLPGDFPFEWFSNIKDGNIDISNDWKQIATDYLGYVIAVVVGIVFILVFPIVGICFCCCRCCGNCGGRRSIKTAAQAGHEDKCGRWTSLSIMAVFTTMALVGSILMFVTNSNLTTSLNDFHNNDVQKVDDVMEFFDSTVEQAEQLVLNNFNFTLKVLFRDLDSIGYLLGIPIRDNVLNSTGLSQVYDSIDSMETDANILYLNLRNLQMNRKIIVEKSELFHNFTIEMNETVSNLSAKYSYFNITPDFVTDFNASELPIEDLKVLSLNVCLSQGISSLTSESKQNLNDIPERVQNETLKQRDDLKKDVSSYTSDVSEIITDLKSMKDDVMKGIDFDSLKDDAKKYTSTATDYDKYRWYGGLGLAGITMVIVLLLTIGMLFGIFGGSPSVDPADRSCISNAGGNMLVAGAIITFIFGWLLMLITTILFAVGAPVDKFGCGAMQNLSVFDKLLDEYELLGSSGGNGSWLGNQVFSGKNVVLKLSEVMESCRKSKTVYVALKMEEANVFNLSDVTDYKKKFNINDKLDSSLVNFDNISITTGPMMNFINVMKTLESTMDYKTYNTTLLINPVEPSKQFLQNLINFTNTYKFSNQNEKKEFESVINQFNDSIRSIGAVLETSINAVQDALTNIRGVTQVPSNNTLRQRCEVLEMSLRNIEQNLSSNAAKAFNDSVKNFEARLTKIVDTFIADMENAVNNEIGKCLPLWNLYSDVVIYGVCKSIIGALGGWWCAIGWTTFFLTVSICASVKLSKHFRRIQFSSEQSLKNSNGKEETEDVHHFKNKVFHADMPDGIKK